MCLMIFAVSIDGILAELEGNCVCIGKHVFLSVCVCMFLYVYEYADDA